LRRAEERCAPQTNLTRIGQDREIGQVESKITKNFPERGLTKAGGCAIIGLSRERGYSVCCTLKSLNLRVSKLIIIIKSEKILTSPFVGWKLTLN